MKIIGARVAVNADIAVRRDFSILEGRITFASREDHPRVALSGFLLLPGFINAHDHLELNLFPQLGSGPYTNAKAWADEIYRPTDSPVKEHLALAKSVRLMWGGLKNLLSGVTTVAHHNPFDAILEDPAFPVRVVKKFGWAHSLDFSPDLLSRYEKTPADWPFLIHAAEGTDGRARGEVRRLEQLGVLSPRTVLVHGIGVSPVDLDLLRARCTSLAWCPSSNLALYGETLGAAVLNSGVKIALGTDSSMTAPVDFCDELAHVRRMGTALPNELYEMATLRAARMLRLTNGEGCIREGGVADLIAVEDRGQTPAEALDQPRIEMTMVDGRIKLASARVLDRIPKASLPYEIALECRGRWSTSVDVPSLYRRTAAALGPEFKLAGKGVTQ